jgi:hypothetical protein
MLWIALLSGVVVAMVHASFFEWAFHRYWLHRPWQPKNVFTAHTLIHHQLCKFEDTFHVHDEEQHEALHFQWWGGPFLILINVTPWVLLGWWLSTTGLDLPYVPYLVALGVTFGLYYLGYEGFHYLMHKPSIAWLEGSKPFLFLKKHHRIHHVHMDKNLNVLLPLADLVLGSLVLEAPVPSTTPPGARALARRHSRFGRQLRGESETDGADVVVEHGHEVSEASEPRG